MLQNIFESQAVILGFVALIILVCIIYAVIKRKKSLIVWLIIGLLGYLYIASSVLN
jgi:hypothetical protein